METTEGFRCVHCGQPNSSLARECGRCGRLPPRATPGFRCGHCGQMNASGVPECGRCQKPRPHAYVISTTLEDDKVRQEVTDSMGLRMLPGTIIDIQDAQMREIMVKLQGWAAPEQAKLMREALEAALAFVRALGDADGGSAADLIAKMERALGDTSGGS